MANWTINEENIRVVSREKEEDTSPETYLERARTFEKNGYIKEAEREYNVALQYAGYSELYYRTLIGFYYRTNPSKGDIMFWKYYKKYNPKGYKIWKIYSRLKYFIAFIAGVVAVTVIDDRGLLQHILGGFLLLPGILSAMNSIIISPNKEMKNAATAKRESVRKIARRTANKEFVNIFKWLFLTGIGICIYCFIVFRL